MLVYRLNIEYSNLSVDHHGTIFLVTAEFDGVPFAHIDGSITLDDGWTGTHIESEFRNTLVKAEGNKVTTSTGLLSIVQDHT